jgi:splicing factor 45
VDWTASADDDDVNQFYIEKAQRGGRKKRKKNNQQKEVVQDWDDIYDPSRPNSYEEYKNSEEKIREVRDWKDKLYAHRMRRKQSSDYTSEEDDRRPAMNSEYLHYRSGAVLILIAEQFAPPASMSFAPPSNLNADPTSPPPADPPDDPTGEDAYARRMRLSQQQIPNVQPLPPLPNAPPGQISVAPIRYTLPPPPPSHPVTEPEAPSNTAEPEPETPRSSRPGQAGFAERLLSKYGWTKGSGLGAQGTGIINPLYAKVDKRKKKPDSEGGGFVVPTTTARIMGGNKSQAAKEDDVGKFGAMSEVVRLQGMLRGLDVEAEIGREGGGLVQEIGEECGGKYGSVERVFIHREGEGEEGPMVFVQFVSALSALRAVNALEGRVFGGNVIKAGFWGREDFEGGRYVK